MSETEQQLKDKIVMLERALQNVSSMARSSSSWFESEIKNLRSNNYKLQLENQELRSALEQEQTNVHQLQVDLTHARYEIKQNPVKAMKCSPN